MYLCIILSDLLLSQDPSVPEGHWNYLYFYINWLASIGISTLAINGMDLGVTMTTGQ